MHVFIANKKIKQDKPKKFSFLKEREGAVFIDLSNNLLHARFVFSFPCASEKLRKIFCSNFFSAVQSVKSNAIVLAREYAPSQYQLIGVGGGQPNRIDSLQRLALPKTIENLLHEDSKQDIRQAMGQLVLASDGFFPFADSIQAAADAGIQYFMQPGGSIRDAEVIQEADRRGLCMIFTGQRYFSH